jgi:hypothetical protein
VLYAWSLDVAREQSPRAEWLLDVLRRSRAAGYNAAGLYLEHRLLYPSAPWAAGPGALTLHTVRQLRSEGRALGLRLIPMLNTLGHMEGFIRCEGGQWLAEGAGRGGLSLQMCPSRPECRDFARGLVADAMECFDDEWVHLGGDETRQLGQCPRCAQRVQQVGQGGLYAEYFGELCRWVLARGRRPCLWADMLLQHPQALDSLPRETVLWDWQYERGPGETSGRLRACGFDVVCCPSLHSYDSAWCFWPLTRENVDAHAADARRIGALGVCLTTWEFCGFSQYGGVLPLIFAAGRRLARGEDWSEALRAEGGAAWARSAEILGEKIPAAAPFLAPGGWRRLRECLVWRQNPFHLWREWREEACGSAGDRVLRLCDAAAEGLDPADPLGFAIELHRVAVEWVRGVEAAYRHYAAAQTQRCAAELERCAGVLERLRPGLLAAASAGGSLADPARLDRLVQHVQVVRERIERLDPACAMRPAFEVISHEAYIPGDQAAWSCGLPGSAG